MDKNIQEKEKEELIRRLIEKSRLKLLDLSRRNPLLFTRFSERSHSHIRVVDELPQVLFDRLVNGKMCFRPLPSLEEDPKDEDTPEFQNALAEARLTDQVYQEALKRIDPNSKESAEELIRIERGLKDRIREKLNMPPRQTKINLSLAQHAKNHNILPSYDLPLPEQENKDGRHKDEFIQTLLLPDLLERRLNGLLNKHKLWMEETGISVLYAAFGFLEWKDKNYSNKGYFAPLLLVPVEIERKTTRKGFEFWISGRGDYPEVNIVLREKLRREFGIDLPLLDNNEEESIDIEAYFVEISRIAGELLSGKIRRQVAIGVFPSAKMAMYYDLDPQKWDFSQHEIIRKILSGVEIRRHESPFGEEYDIDSPHIETKVPLLVMDADSSQHSVIVDIMDGKNLSVEGPPGTGKSQTIVNTIAAALYKGKKVLFVAQKMAALEVVRSRLEACGLGEFLLTLQARRSGREEVIASVRKRLEMRELEDPEGLDRKIKEFRRKREEINRYIQISSSRFAETSFTVYDILGWGIKAYEILKQRCIEKETWHLPDLQKMNKETLENLLSECNYLEQCWKETQVHNKDWRIVKRTNIDPFTADEILSLAQKSLMAFEKVCQERKALESIFLDIFIRKEELTSLKDILSDIHLSSGDLDFNFIMCVVKEQGLRKVYSFFEDSERLLREKEGYETYLKDPLLPGLSVKIMELKEAMECIGIKYSSIEMAEERLREIEEDISAKEEAQKLLEEIFKLTDKIKHSPVSLIVKMRDIISTFGEGILALRSPALMEPEAKEIILKGNKIAQKLLKQKSELEEIFTGLEEIQEREIKEIIEIFKKRNPLKYLTSRYWKSRRFYKNLCHRKIARTERLSLLENLSEWVKKKEIFSSDKTLSKYIPSFSGIDTDFCLFIRLFEFYEVIEKEFKKEEGKAIKELFQHAPVEILCRLPEIPLKHPLRTLLSSNYKRLRQEIETLKRKKEKWLEAKGCIDKYRQLLADDKVEITMLEKLSREVEKFQKEWGECENDRFIKDILKERFKGPMHLPDNLKLSLCVVEKITSLKRDLQLWILDYLRQGRRNDALNIISSILSFEDDAFDKLKRFVESLDNKEALNDFSLLNSSEIAKRLKRLLKDKKGLIAYSRFYSAKLKISSEGYGEVIDRLLNSFQGLENFANLVNALIGKELAKDVYRIYGGDLARYSGIKLHNLRERIKELDEEILSLSRQRLRAKLRKDSHPPLGNKVRRRSEWTELALLNKETTKKKRFLPAGELTKRAGKALLELKPCWMISPLAIAQYIDKKDITFDLVIIDEASQMSPEEALGAIVRGKQLMVVGDVNQLPPTTFFRKLLEVFENEKEHEEEILIEESILEITNVIFPKRRLRWHYRSKYPELIAFCNKYVYDDTLVVFPSPSEKKAVEFHKVEGFYSKGTNPIEAQEIAKSAIDFMHRYKDKSLGIVLLNQKQQQLVVDEIEYLISRDPIAQEYIDYWEKEREGLESFFVKNLENVQGDERDVIFIGTVYGPEYKGAPVMQRFGPINGINGKRRLNVLFSRARDKIVTFSSMTSEDIRVDGHSNEGVYLLKRWFEYCASGYLIQEKRSRYSSKPQSPFEEHVIAQIESFGCEAIPQVGVAGYYIDIGVKHPQWPYGFIMGVECDGFSFHSSKSARDRDRLREKILKDRGWCLYRIWSIDWFEDPVGEARKLRVAIENRVKELKKSIG